MGSWNYVASSGSSTTEGASDVSLSHLFHLSPGTCRLFLFVFLLLCCVLGWFLFCVFSSCFASAWSCFDLYPRVLDDRQCFIARSAMRKKKRTARSRVNFARSCLGKVPGRMPFSQRAQGERGDVSQRAHTPARYYGVYTRNEERG